MPSEPLTPEQWQAVWALVQACEPLPADQWRGHIASAGVASQVGEEASRILAESRSLETRPPTPDLIGNYRILRRIAEGGMGVVYQAEQAHPRRIVALKVIRPGQATAAHLRRFEIEGEALGRLRHSGIAQIYESGTADTAFGLQPFFAMEFVDGQPLLEYAGARRLDVRQRLIMIQKVCGAVQHAHEQGIVHRDLKPSNILVDATGQPKVLDFGVARLTDSDAAVTRQTQVGELVGTLEYMSPEQVTGDPSAVDARTDIYALGVLLYELLSGRPPYAIRDKSLPEVVRIIHDEEPARLNTVNRLFHGDVETIVGKALEKEKARRYASAAALADDIARYLDDQPIAARPPSTGYQLRKFARRHRALVGSSAAVLLALIAGTGVSVYQAVQARRASQVASAVNAFLQQDLLSQASADVQAASGGRPDPDLKVRTALDRAAERIGGRFPEQPTVEAAIRQTLGRTYMDLGLFAKARPHLERAATLRRGALSPRDPETLQTLASLAEVALREGRNPEAAELGRQALDLRRSALGSRHPDTLASLNLMAAIERALGRYRDAEQLYAQAADLRKQSLGEAHRDTLRSLDGLANVYLYLDKYSQAVDLNRRVLEIRQRVLGPDHPDTILSKQSLALAYHNDGLSDRAAPLYTEVLQWQRRILGSSHFATLATINNLGNVIYSQGDFGQAERLYAECLETRIKVFGEEHADTLITKNNLANVYMDQGDYARATRMQKEILEVNRRTLGPEHPNTLRSMLNLGTALGFQGRLTEAERLLGEVVELRRRVLGPRHPNTLHAMHALARTYELAGRPADAERMHRQVLDLRREVLRPGHPDTLRAQTSLAMMLVGQRRYREAEALLRGAMAPAPSPGRATWEDAMRQSYLGMTLMGQDRLAAAEPLLRAGYFQLLDQRARLPAHLGGEIDRARQALAAVSRALNAPLDERRASK